jgi:hypothetical protein
MSHLNGLAMACMSVRVAIQKISVLPFERERWQRSELAQAFPIRLSNSPPRPPVLSRWAKRKHPILQRQICQGNNTY